MAIDTSAPLASAGIPSNTLTLTNFEPSHFDNTEFLAKLRSKTASYGPICFFSPIRTFRRIFVVYESTFDAQRAKATLHNSLFEGTTLRVYFGSHTELSVDSDRYYLHLPTEIKVAASEHHDVTFTGLHSPPGSPPLGHTEMVMDEDDEMTMLELPSSSSSSSSQEIPVTVPVAAAVTTPSSSLVSKFSTKLRIDTQPFVPAMSSNSQARTGVSPISPSGGLGGSLYPSTPTLLAFSPAQDSKGEQPFITIQDWAQCC
jgi:hypothetical protein